MNLHTLVRSIVRFDKPTSKQKLTLVKMASVIIWADGIVEDSEKLALSEFLGEIDGMPKLTCSQIIDNTKELTDELRQELSALPKQYAHKALKISFRMANADDKIVEEELAVIKEIAACILPDKKWEDVHSWIQAYDSYIKSTKVLFSNDSNS